MKSIPEWLQCIIAGTIAFIVIFIITYLGASS